MHNHLSLISLLPPILVLVLGCITRRVLLSLVAGIVLAALIAANFVLPDALGLFYNILWKNLEFKTFFSSSTFWETGNLFICIFLLLLGIFITMLQLSGGAYAYSLFASRKVKSRKSAESASLLLSCGLFIDDYLSCLTVGSVMYPLTDTQKIPRAKLAYLVDSLSGSLTILCPFSSWAAAMVGFLSDNGVSEYITVNTLIVANPLSMFLNILPYVFYSFILFPVVWYIVRWRVSFGLMKKHEQVAHTTGNLFGGTNTKIARDKVDHNPHHTTLLEFFLPIGVLLISVVGGILYSGHWWVLGGYNALVQAFQQASAAAGLFIGGVLSLIICTIFFVLRQRIEIKQIPAIYWQGIKLMFPSIVILMLSWTFGDFLRNQLHTGEYLATLLLNTINVTCLPILLYFVAFCIAFTIGSAWGTAAMLFPIVIPLVLTMINAPPQPTLIQVPILFPVLGAILSGCVAGNHVSPIADTTIMSALSTGVSLRDHAYTQMQYALPGILITGLAYLLSGLLIEHGLLVTVLVPIICAIAANIAILKTLQ